ncbi:hypothetical protein [Lysinibacillus capsici]|uniref:hypothetical protein n=1 Tax=Lysinibacillus capsici TaxID=2115968 RepID=UPI0034E248A0
MGITTLITEGNLYIDRHSVGQFHLYLALESAEEIDESVKVIDLTKDAPVYLSSQTVLEYWGVFEKLDDELKATAEKYGKFEY